MRTLIIFFISCILLYGQNEKNLLLFTSSNASTDTAFVIGLSTTYVSDFSSDADDWSPQRSDTAIVDGVLSFDDVIKTYPDNVDNSHYIQREVYGSATNLIFKIRFYIPNGNTNVDSWRILDQGAQPTWHASKLTKGNLSNSYISGATGEWAWLSGQVTVGDTYWRLFSAKSSDYTYVGANSESDDIVYFRDITFYDAAWDAGSVSVGDSTYKTWMITENNSGWAPSIEIGTHFRIDVFSDSLRAWAIPQTTGAVSDTINVTISDNVKNFPSNFYIILNGAGT
jgi:hypothetical protein